MANPRTSMVASVFDRSAQTYDHVGIPWFTPIAARLVAELAPQPGERALDVGAGRGAALFTLAGAVGESGHVTGIDLAAGMVAALTADTGHLTNVDIQLMDAQSPDLPAASFDLIASSLVVFFLPDPPAALQRWRELLRPGGRIGISTFGPQDEHWLAIDAIFSPYLPQQLLDARTSGTSGPFGSDAGVESLLTKAGFEQPRTVTATIEAHFENEEQWHTWTWSHGQRVMWEHVPEADRPAVRAAAAQRLEQARDGHGPITLTQQVRYTLAQNPSTD